MYVDPATMAPPGCTAIEGHHDHLSRKVDLESRTVVDYQPPQPDAEHEWHEESKRWRKRPDVLAREAKEQSARNRIEALEESSRRPMRELALDPDNATARAKLVAIEAQIVAARADLGAAAH